METQEAKKLTFERKRCILHLINQYLTENRLAATAKALLVEANFQGDEYQVCDNVDLDTVFLEYCSYHMFKFGKMPLIIKKKEGVTEDSNLISNTVVKRRQPKTNLTDRRDRKAPIVEFPLADSLKVVQISNIADCKLPTTGQRILKSINEIEGQTKEWMELAELVCRDIVQKDFQIKWENIHGNTEGISVIKEAVLLPLQHPELFSDNIKPWRSVLMYGPPGTGKSLIAKALCSEIFEKITFFNISCSTLVSKWRGDSEKIIRVLFDVARFYAPSVIFIDEIEGLTSRRDCLADHEATKRFKNEFLVLLDGIESENHGIFFLANTNLPWEIDPAFLRRFERKILIGLPDFENRKNLILSLIRNSSTWSKTVLDDLSSRCEGYTGDEIRIACKEATMNQIRKRAVHLKSDHELRISDGSLLEAFTRINPISKNLLKKHMEWSKTYGTI